MAVNFASWRKSLLEDYVKRYNVPLPNQGKYTRRDYIDAIRYEMIKGNLRIYPRKIIMRSWKSLNGII